MKTTATEKPVSSILQEVDLLLEDFPVETLAGHFYDVFKSHLRAADGYDPEALADQYEIGTRLLNILRAREKEIAANKELEKRKSIAKQRRKTYQQERAKVAEQQ